MVKHQWKKGSYYYYYFTIFYVWLTVYVTGYTVFVLIQVFHEQLIGEAIGDSDEESVST